MIVIVMTKVPMSLRGDLTQWAQEIQTGVYVSNVNAKVRDLLWSRIVQEQRDGRASMAYSMNNEIGYEFRTTDPSIKIADLDGVPLVEHLIKRQSVQGSAKHGFSNASKFRRAYFSRRITKTHALNPINKTDPTFVSLDIETTGTSIMRDVILSIGATKSTLESPIEDHKDFYQLIKTDKTIPLAIEDLTGISISLINKKGIELKEALVQLSSFIGRYTIVGYNVRFDEQFINKAFRSVQIDVPTNRYIDLMPLIKKDNMFLDNYKLGTVLPAYSISPKGGHNALIDAQHCLLLAKKLNEKSLIRI